jgi:hypothetical protein
MKFNTQNEKFISLGIIILKWIFKKWDGGGGGRTGLIWLRIGTGGGLL